MSEAQTSAALTSDNGAALNRAIRQTLTDAKEHFRISEMIHLGAMLGEEWDDCDVVRKFCEDLDDQVVQNLREHLDLTGVDLEDEDMLLVEFGDHCVAQNKCGFLCKVDVPEVVPITRGAKEVRWYVYHQRWFYAETLAGIIDQARAWSHVAWLSPHTGAGAADPKEA